MVFSFRDGLNSRKPALRGPAEVRAYWEALRRHGALPGRADLDPRGMADVLDQVFVAERIGRSLLQLRIAGMALADLAGLEMKGLPLSSLFLPEARPQLADVVEAVLTRPQVAELHLEAECGIGRPALRAQLLLLPLRPLPAGQALVLGCLASAGDIGRSPRRFAISRIAAEPLDQPSALPTVIRPAPSPAQAIPQVPQKRHPHLRLVHSAP